MNPPRLKPRCFQSDKYTRRAVLMSKGRYAMDASPQKKFPFIEETPKGVFLRVRLQPRSSKNSIVGVQGGSLKVRLTAPPVEGSANRALIEFLSELTGVRKSSISIDSGLKSREKRVLVEGVTIEDLEKVFYEALK